MELAEGKLIAEHYKLLKQLGRGSFGEVWLAHNLLADIDVAIKFYGAFDMKGLDEFRTEFKLAYRLHHPNLLNISHFDVCDNCPYLVMPYCANGSVSHQIGRMTEADIWKFASDVANGLSFLHSQQPPIIHQDIKPDNILITADGRYVISDFGISRNLRTKMSATSNTGSSGTIAYMGPERFSEKPVIVLASDIWALGMTLFELMSGDVMWEGMGGCVQLNGARMPVMDQRFSAELQQLVTACLAPQTWDRPTAEQVYEYAEAHLHGKPLPPLTNHPTYQPVQQPTPEPAYQAPEPAYRAPEPAPAYRPVQQTAQTDRQSGGWPWKRILTVAAAVLAAIAVVSGIALFIGTIREEQRFTECQTVEDLEQFIADYPNSSYVETARKRIATLKPQTTDEVQPTAEATDEAPATEQRVEVQTVTTTAPARQQAAPAKPFRRPVRSAAKEADDAAFYNCVTSGDFHNYLTNFPNGRHRDKAERALTNLLKNEGGTAIPTNSVNNRPVVTSPGRPPRGSMPPRRGYRSRPPRR